MKRSRHEKLGYPREKGKVWESVSYGFDWNLCHSSIQFSHSVMSDFLWPHGLQNTSLRCPSLSPGVCSNSCPLSQWRHSTISSSVVPFFSCLQSFQASGSLPVSQFFVSGAQNIRASAPASVLPMNIQDWFPLGWTGWISLQSKRLSRVFSNTSVQKHKFFDTQLSLWSLCHIHTWLLENFYNALKFIIKQITDFIGFCGTDLWTYKYFAVMFFWEDSFLDKFDS